MRLRLLLLTGLLRLRGAIRTAASAATATPALRLLARRSFDLLLRTLRVRIARRALLLLLPLLVRLILATTAAALLARTALAAGLVLLRLTLSLTLLLLRTVAAAGTATLRPLAFRLAAGALLELAHLSLHVFACLRVLLRAELVMSAIRAALPSLGIGFAAGAAEDTFRERHRETARIVHSAFMPLDRRETLKTLIGLAEESSPTSCFDDQRAIELLRSQATPEELRELGASEQLLDLVFPERS